MIHGGAPAGWLEFSANLNPTGVPAAVAAAIASATYDGYTSLDPTAAEAHLAMDAGVPADAVLLTAGATEAIRLVASAFAARGRAVIVGPTYTEYARLAEQVGAEIVAARAEPPTFDPPIGRALGSVPAGGGVVFVCDPNNPTGRALGQEGLRQLLAAVPSDLTLVLDQSFAPFAPPTLSASECIAGGNVLLVRSLTKMLAVPGLRLGYVIAQPRSIAALRALQDPWSVAAHAIAAAMAASWALPAGMRAAVVSWRERLVAALAEQGLNALPSEANFVLVHVGSATAALVAALADRRIALRSCASFGLPEYVRIAVRPPAEQDALLTALAAIRGDLR
jgi:histidinol-phosphate/aromatic aminotransferase/cobyric acid decarboxylase-like protein